MAATSSKKSVSQVASSPEKCLIIVESPAKVKTIQKYLEKNTFHKNFQILASYGHVRDLLPKQGAIDTEHHFEMTYAPLEKNAKHVSAIVQALKKSDALYFATDPDREGEAISWHLHQMLEERGALKNKIVHRIVFYEITQSAVQYAIEHPRAIDMSLVDAYKARRGLDFLVGYTLSPVLWRKVRAGLSAGRVQSPALRMIVEREEEIEQFTSEEYWTIKAELGQKAAPFQARLIEWDGKKLKQFSITHADQAHSIVKKLLEEAKGSLVVKNIEKKQRKRNPSPPFITSTLQQESARKLNFTTDRTMRVAQQLYEGIDTGQGPLGLITYMRTDSVNLAQEALQHIREFIGEKYGASFVPKTPNYFRRKSKNAQEAHEGIRPTDIERTPDSLKPYLTSDQLKLYTLIWKRTVACQMIHATLNNVAIDLACGKDNLFRANGSTIAHPGFMSVYLEGTDDGKGVDDSKEQPLPELQEGEVVPLLNIESLQHFTEPPPRYTEASLVKALEEHGIGRPSTYASIIFTLKNRKYVELANKQFIPTDVGRIVKKFLTTCFKQYVDYTFTAKMEDQLDDISRGEKAWVPMLEDFWKTFKNQVDEVSQSVSRQEFTQEETDEKCPLCEKPLAIKLGRYGRFVTCTGYPDCKYKKSMDGEETTTNEPEILEGRNCPTCQSSLQIKRGPYGKFIGCTAYPKCRFIEPLEKPKSIDITCPVCKKGHFIERKSRFGTFFYSCSTYPTCKYAISHPPIAESCPQCQWPILTLKVTKRHGTEKVCPQKECKYAVVIEPPK